MPVSKRFSCEVQRERLIDLIMDGKTQEMEATELTDHLATCPSCRSLWEASRSLRPAFALPDLYTPGLRYRTLERLAAQADSSDRIFLRLMIPVSFLSLLFWFAVPLAVLAWLFNYWLAWPWFSLLLSLVFLTSLGFLFGCLAFLALTRGNAEHLRGRMKDLLEGFHA